MTKTNLDQALDYAHQTRESFLQSLKDFASIPSVSTDQSHQADIHSAAAWLAKRLEHLGMQNVAVMPTDMHPVVYAEWLQAPGKPVVLIYGHYDVQPVDPISLWQTDPFNPTSAGEYLFARGASDMKGQVVAALSALESILKSRPLPVNVKFLFEGEEEIGSPSLARWMKDHQALLKADFCLNPDAGMLAKDSPTITYGLRGLVYFELKVFGPENDMHSGMVGGVIHNPAQALAELIAAMHDANGKVTLPGFYDRVRTLSQDERAQFAQLPNTESKYLELTGVKALWGEPEFTPAERLGARPTLEINGLLSGFTEAGQKTVLPSHAMAKISCRLVPDQDPDEVDAQFRRFLTEKAPPTIRWELEKISGAPGSITNLDQPGIRALAAAQEVVWQKKPVYVREGGSIPVVGMMQSILGIESVLTGFGLPEDHIHSPNERLHLPTWYKGIDALIHFFYNL